MDAIDSVVDPLREFSKDSIRLVKRCHKPDRKGIYFIHIFSIFVDFVWISVDRVLKLGFLV